MANQSIVNKDFTTFPTLGGTNSFVGSNSFKQVDAPLPLVRLPTTLTATSGTILNGELLAGVLEFMPSANASWTLPTAANIDSLLSYPSVSRGVDVRLLNFSAFSVTINANTGVSLAGFIGGAIVMPPLSAIWITIAKTAATPTYIVYGSLMDSASGAQLGANNIFTGLNTFTGALTDFEEARMAYAAINGPAVITSSMGFAATDSGLLTTSSFTLTSAQVAGIIVRLNGALATQTVFMPTAANFEAHLLSSFPPGGSLPTSVTYHLRVINQSTTAVATLTANTNFLISSTLISTLAVGTYKDFLINKTAGTPEYTVY